MVQCGLPQSPRLSLIAYENYRTFFSFKVGTVEAEKDRVILGRLLTDEAMINNQKRFAEPKRTQRVFWKAINV